LIQAVELAAFGLRQEAIAAKGRQQTGCQGRVDFLEQFEVGTPV
jgi:hypothetical protein